MSSKVIYTEEAYSIHRRNGLTDDARHVLDNAPLGTEGVVYEHLNRDEHIAHLHNPVLLSIQEGDRILGTAVFCQTDVSVGPHSYNAYYVRYFAASGEIRGRGIMKHFCAAIDYADLAHNRSGILVMHKNLRERRSTDIYARMETRRNYLSMNQLATHLLRPQAEGYCLDRSGIVNVQAAISLSVFELCRRFFKSVHLLPLVRLREPSPIDAEDHHPSRLPDAKLIINDQVEEWIKWQWMRPSLPCQL